MNTALKDDPHLKTNSTDPKLSLLKQMLIYLPFSNPSCVYSSVDGNGFLTPAPQATNGVSVSLGWPAPWEPMIITYRIDTKVT